MDAKEEMLGLLNKVWVKLQGLPNASAVELGAFCVLLTFMCESPLSITTVFFKSELVMMLFLFALPQWSSCS